jgi:hypothetical protein
MSPYKHVKLKKPAICCHGIENREPLPHYFTFSKHYFINSLMFSKVNRHIKFQDCTLNNANIVPNIQTSVAIMFLLKPTNMLGRPTTYLNS